MTNRDSSFAVIIYTEMLDKGIVTPEAGVSQEQTGGQETILRDSHTMKYCKTSRL